MHFATLIFEKLDFKVHTLFSLFSLSKICSFLSLSLHSSSPTFELLSMVSYGGELVLDSSSPWNDVSNHISSFSIPLPFDHQEAKDYIDEEDPRPTSSTCSYNKQFECCVQAYNKTSCRIYHSVIGSYNYFYL